MSLWLGSENFSGSDSTSAPGRSFGIPIPIVAQRFREREAHRRAVAGERQVCALSDPELDASADEALAAAGQHACDRADLVERHHPNDGTSGARASRAGL